MSAIFGRKKEDPGIQQIKTEFGENIFKLLGEKDTFSKLKVSNPEELGLSVDTIKVFAAEAFMTTKNLSATYCIKPGAIVLRYKATPIENANSTNSMIVTELFYHFNPESPTDWRMSSGCYRFNDEVPRICNSKIFKEKRPCSDDAIKKIAQILSGKTVCSENEEEWIELLKPEEKKQERALSPRISRPPQAEIPLSIMKVQNFLVTLTEAEIISMCNFALNIKREKLIKLFGEELLNKLKISGLEMLERVQVSLNDTGVEDKSKPISYPEYFNMIGPVAISKSTTNDLIIIAIVVDAFITEDAKTAQMTAVELLVYQNSKWSLQPKVGYREASAISRRSSQKFTKVDATCNSFIFKEEMNENIWDAINLLLDGKRIFSPSRSSWIQLARFKRENISN